MEREVITTTQAAVRACLVLLRDAPVKDTPERVRSNLNVASGALARAEIELEKYR